MALPTAWELLLPNFNVTTVIGIIFIAVAIFGGTFLKAIGSGLSFITGNKIKSGALIAIFLLVGIFLVWGVSITQDLLASKEFLLILAGVIFFIALVIAFFGKKGDTKLSL